MCATTVAAHDQERYIIIKMNVFTYRYGENQPLPNTPTKLR